MHAYAYNFQAIKLLRVLMRAGDSDKRKDILREQLDQIDSASGITTYKAIEQSVELHYISVPQFLP
jgi:hypothetical protein